MTQPADKPALDPRRRGIRRTAWLAALFAVGVHVAFLLSVLK